MVDGRFARNIGTITGAEQARLGRACAGVVGLGGIGSPAFESLVRAGIGNFVIFDKDRFEKGNFNRQIYANGETEGRPKAEVARGRALAINPSAKVEACLALDGRSVRKLKRCDIVVDGTDNLATRKLVAAFCGKNKIPYVFCSAGGSTGMCGVFCGADFSKVFGTAKEMRRKHVIAPAAITAGALSAAQAIAVLLGKKFVEAPEFIFFDLFSERLLWRQRI